MTQSSEPEIEIAPEMIEAGASLIASYFDQPIDWLTEDRAREIFIAMAKVMRQPNTKGPDDGQA